MRILFIFHTPWLKGGASKSGLALVEGLRDKGHEIVAACPAEDTMSNQLRSKGIDTMIFNYGWAYPHFKRNSAGIIKYIPQLILNKITNRKALRELKKFCLEFKPDLIHTNSSVADIGWKAAKELGVPHVSHFREFGWKDCSAVMWHERRMCRYDKQYGIAIGKEILKFHSDYTNHITLIYNGIIQTRTSRLNDCKDQWFLYVGGLFKEKGIEDLLLAYSRLDNTLRNTHRLKIAGSAEIPSYLIHLKQLSAQLGIDNDIDWLGERSDVQELMYHAKALIVPSHHEAFGRIVVEAMNNGCIVAGKDSDGIKEQFDNGREMTSSEIGLRFTDTDELTHILTLLAEKDSAEYLPMVGRSQKTIEALYTIQGYIERTEQFYNQIIRK